MKNLLGDVAWRREVSPIRAAILTFMDEPHQIAFLRPTHCQLWKDQRDIDPAVAAAALVERMDTLRAAAHAAYDTYAAYSTSLGFYDDSAGALIMWRRLEGTPLQLELEDERALLVCRAAQNPYWEFMRGRSARFVAGYRVGVL